MARNTLTTVLSAALGTHSIRIPGKDLQTALRQPEFLMQSAATGWGQLSCIVRGTMTTIDVPVASEQSVQAARMTWRWFLKRSALTVAILASGIICACWLYAAASPDAASDTPVKTQVSVVRGV